MSSTTVWGKRRRSTTAAEGASKAVEGKRPIRLSVDGRRSARVREQRKRERERKRKSSRKEEVHVGVERESATNNRDRETAAEIARRRVSMVSESAFSGQWLSSCDVFRERGERERERKTK